jgi:hypothetical protein
VGYPKPSCSAARRGLDFVDRAVQCEWPVWQVKVSWVVGTIDFQLIQGSLLPHGDRPRLIVLNR